MVHNKNLTQLPLMAFFLLIVGWLFYPAMDSFFANDDWVILYHNYQISPWQPWLYFNPNTIWFYRPLQSMQYGLTWHSAGLNHRAYNFQLLTMHLMCCSLVWLIVRRMFSTGFAWLTAMLFSCSWIYADVLLWKANLNSLQHALTTLVASLGFIYYLDTSMRRWFWIFLFSAILNCFTKESSVNLSAVLAVIYLTRYLQWLWDQKTLPDSYPDKRNWKAHGKLFVKFLAPAIVITAVYCGLHLAFVRNVLADYASDSSSVFSLSYSFATVETVLVQWLKAINHSLFGFLYDPIFFGTNRLTSQAIKTFFQYGFAVPVIILLLAVLKRNTAIIFSIFFIAVSHIPTFVLTIYYASRYYYLPAMGGAIFLVACTYAPICRLARKNNSLKEKLLGYSCVLVLAWALAANIVQFQNLIAYDRGQSEAMRGVVAKLETVQDEIPPDAVVVFRNVPQSYMMNGMGATEMISLLTGREDVIGLLDTEKLTGSKQDMVYKRQQHFLLDAMSTSSHLLRLK